MADQFKYELFTNVLNVINARKGKAQLVEFLEEPVCSAGDSYTSNIKRVLVKYYLNKQDVKEVSVIYKTQVRGTLVEDWTLELDFFKTEIRMFTEIFPLLSRITKKSVSSECYAAREHPDYALVLQDLRPLGYVMQDRTAGFDMQHAKAVLKTLAQFHAGSMVLYKRDGRVKEFTKGLFGDTQVSKKWMTDGLKSLAKTCNLLPNCQRIGEKLSKLGDEAIQRGLKAAKRSEGAALNVLNHGDMWANNMLFLHDKDGMVLDTKLIDFQLVKFTSPALDLHYFFATSLQMDNVWGAHDKLLDFYYSSLLSALVQYDFALAAIPGRKEVQQDFEARAFYGVIALATVTPLVKAPARSDANFENLCKTDNDPNSFREYIYSCKNYMDAVKRLMPYFDSLGVFN